VICLKDVKLDGSCTPPMLAQPPTCWAAAHVLAVVGEQMNLCACVGARTRREGRGRGGVRSPEATARRVGPTGRSGCAGCRSMCDHFDLSCPRRQAIVEWSGGRGLPQIWTAAGHVASVDFTVVLFPHAPRATAANTGVYPSGTRVRVHGKLAP
jgi:hypothetical protein